MQHNIPFQLTLEDDLRLNRASFGTFVEHACALAEEQHLVAARAQPVQQPVEERELGGGSHEVLAL